MVYDLALEVTYKDPNKQSCMVIFIAVEYFRAIDSH